MPVFLERQRSTACCRRRGQVRITDAEISPIAPNLGMAGFGFIDRRTRLASDRRGLALLDKPGGECAFLNGDLRSIQSVKPRQRRDFPNLWTYPSAGKSCRAIPVQVGEAEFWRLVSRTTGRSLPDPFQIPEHADDPS